MKFLALLQTAFTIHNVLSQTCTDFIEPWAYLLPKCRFCTSGQNSCSTHVVHNPSNSNWDSYFQPETNVSPTTASLFIHLGHAISDCTSGFTNDTDTVPLSKTFKFEYTDSAFVNGIIISVHLKTPFDWTWNESNITCSIHYAQTNRSDTTQEEIQVIESSKLKLPGTNCEDTQEYFRIATLSTPELSQQNITRSCLSPFCKKAVIDAARMTLSADCEPIQDYFSVVTFTKPEQKATTSPPPSPFCKDSEHTKVAKWLPLAMAILVYSFIAESTVTFLLILLKNKIGRTQRVRFQRKPEIIPRNRKNLLTLLSSMVPKETRSSLTSNTSGKALSSKSAESLASGTTGALSEFARTLAAHGSDVGWMAANTGVWERFSWSSSSSGHSRTSRETKSSRKLSNETKSSQALSFDELTLDLDDDKEKSLQRIKDHVARSNDQAKSEESKTNLESQR